MRVAEQVVKKYGLTIRNIKMKNMEKEIQNIRDVYNDAWSRNWGFVPFTDAEIEHLATDLKQLP